MESEYSKYDLHESLVRIANILNSADKNYTEQDSIPARSSLTFNNGYYVNCSALFVDMRGSIALPEQYNKVTLARVYKSYISELVAIMRDNKNISETSIEGDCVWALFSTPTQRDLWEVLDTAAKAASIVDVLNVCYAKRGYPQIRVGIGIAYGQVLMIKAGQKSSGVNEVAWMGKLVGEAARLCSYGNRTYQDKRIMVSNVFYDNLDSNRKNNLTKNYIRECFHGDVIWTTFNQWVAAQQ